MAQWWNRLAGIGLAGWVAAAVGGVVAAPVAAIAGGAVFVAAWAGMAGIAVSEAIGERNPQPQDPSPGQLQYVIEDRVWKERWDTAWEGALQQVTEMIQSAIHTTDTQPQLRETRSRSEPPEKKEEEAKKLVEYKEAIENGCAVNMGFGQIIILGAQEDQKVSLLRDVMDVPDIGLEEHVNLVMHENKFHKMTKEEEGKEMALLAKKVIESNPKCKLKEIIDNVLVVKIFKPECSTEAIKPENTEDTVISMAVRNLVSSLKEDGNSSVFDISETSSSLLHVSDCTAFGFLENVIPAFITARSIFFLISPTCTSCGVPNVSEAEGTDHMAQWIAYINSGVTEKAKKYIEALEGKDAVSQSPPSYPKIFVIGSQADEDKIKSHFQQSAVQYITMKVIDGGSLSENPKVKELGKETKESVKGLVLQVPLAWEFFRKILNSLQHGGKHFISVEKVAALALLCGIAIKHLQSVLNFYHEHGAILYYPAIPHLKTLVILNPKWFLKQFQCLYDLTTKDTMLSDCFKTKGILADNLISGVWKQKEFSQGIIELMTTLHLATKIPNSQVPHEICDLQCSLYFVPSVLNRRSSSTPSRVSGVFNAARLHLAFKSGYVPPGCYVRLVSKLLEDNDRLQLDFYTEMYQDQLSFVYGNLDRITIFTTQTSICVDLIREKPCSENRKKENFPTTCHDILSLLDSAGKRVLKESFAPIEIYPAFLCECQQNHHYVEIATTTTYSTSKRCRQKNIYTFNKDEQLWLEMKFPIFSNGDLSDYELRKLIQEVSNHDFLKMTKALEISGNPDKGKFMLLKDWCHDMEESARKHLLFHLRQLDLEDVAKTIDHGADYSMAIPKVYDESPETRDLMNQIAAIIPAKWRFVGIQLGLTENILDDIAVSAPFPLECFRKMLLEWKKRKPRPYTWMTIIEALETPSVGEVALAECIKQWLTVPTDVL